MQFERMKPLRAFQQAFNGPAPYRFAVIARTRLILSFDAVAPNGRRRPHYQRKSAGTVTVLRFASVIIRHKAAGKRKQVGLVVFTHPFECVIGILIVIVRLFANGLEHLFFGKTVRPVHPDRTARRQFNGYAWANGQIERLRPRPRVG